MTRILQFTSGPEDWKGLLADPKHWRAGFSARTLAHAWEAADGLPPEVEEPLARCKDSLLQDVEPLMAVPEFRVPLPGGKRPSQNDLFLLARSRSGPVVMMVEGKCKEPFGPTVGEWGKTKTEDRKKRLRFLLEVLGVPNVKPSSTAVRSLGCW